MNTLTCVYCGHEYPEGTPPYGVKILTDHIRVCEKHPMRQLELDKETHIMQLVAIMTATIQNTDTTIKDRIGRDNPYWTQAYDDVCKAIDREMECRNKYNELLFSIGNKFPDETRHQTALRYIQEAEKGEIGELRNIVNGCDGDGYSLDREFNE